MTAPLAIPKDLVDVGRTDYPDGRVIYWRRSRSTGFTYAVDADGNVMDRQDLA